MFYSWAFSTISEFLPDVATARLCSTSKDARDAYPECLKNKAMRQLGLRHLDFNMLTPVDEYVRIMSERRSTFVSRRSEEFVGLNEAFSRAIMLRDSVLMDYFKNVYATLGIMEGYWMVSAFATYDNPDFYKYLDQITCPSVLDNLRDYISIVRGLIDISFVSGYDTCNKVVKFLIGNNISHALYSLIDKVNESDVEIIADICAGTGNLEIIQHSLKRMSAMFDQDLAEMFSDGEDDELQAAINVQMETLLSLMRDEDLSPESRGFILKYSTSGMYCDMPLMKSAGKLEQIKSEVYKMYGI